MNDHAPPPDPADSAPGPSDSAPRALGRRISELRNGLGMTQQELSDRVAISRVALSNLESGRSVPGERTVTLLAGVFHLEPHELVAGTDYPAAKAERLPLVAARHTSADLLVALCERDRMWLEGAPPAVAERVTAQWRRDLSRAVATTADPREADRLRAALASLD